MIGLFNIKNMGLEPMHEAYEEVQGTIERDWKDVWANGLKMIYFGFYEQVYELLVRVLARHEEQLKWVLRTHLCNYVVESFSETM